MTPEYVSAHAWCDLAVCCSLFGIDGELSCRIVGLEKGFRLILHDSTTGRYNSHTAWDLTDPVLE